MSPTAIWATVDEDGHILHLFESYEAAAHEVMWHRKHVSALVPDLLPPRIKPIVLYSVASARERWGPWLEPPVGPWMEPA